MLNKITIGLLVVGVLSACSSDLPPEVAGAYEQLPERIDFNYHVRPILSDRCYSCHGPDANSRKAGLRLDLQEKAFAALANGQGHAFVPGSINGSQALQRVLSDDPELLMPPPESNLSLSAEEKAILVKWVEQGASWKPHWSFIPPKKAPLPKLTDEDWAKNEIDKFILARQELNGLSPASQASKEQLLRRVYLDLVGLPPTLEEIDAFVADDSEDAYEKVVDRLLNSPEHAERLALDWMDVARYADSHGLHADGWRYMWPWRDWVIQAFQRNMPYDQFVTWQMAGDLLPEADREQKLATAFNRNHTMTAEGGVIDEEFRLSYVFDRVNTASTAFLGMTMECAQCHDHKFDPISQKEYYQMSAFFNNVRELGMTGDDGNYGPMLLLTTEKEEALKQKLDRQIDSLENQMALTLEEVQSQTSFLANLTSEAVDLPKPLGYYPLDDMASIQANKNTKFISGDRHKRGELESAEFAPGIKGHAPVFNNEYTSVELYKTGLFETYEPYSALVWVKPAQDGKIQDILATAGHKNNYWRGWEFLLDSMNRPTVKLVHSLPHNMIHVRAKVSVPVDQWSHLAFAYDGSSKAAGVSIFINGVRAEVEVCYDQLYKSIYPVKGGNHEKNPNAPIRVGKSNRSFTGEFGIFKGMIDEIHLFDERLTEPQVNRIYQSYKNENPADSEFEASEIAYYLASGKPDWKTVYRQLTKVRQSRQQLLDSVPEIMVMEEMDQPRKTYVLNRGQYDSPTQEVEPSTPEYIMPFPENLPKNRLGFSKWLFHKKNPLTARVTVNRYWQMIFGKGLVTTPHDFGSQGKLPTHPELLDYLAVELMENEWNIRELIRKMVLSATYRQSSFVSEAHRLTDIQNQYYTRGVSYRLPAEIIRDNALATSGLLVKRVGGPSVKPYQPEGLWIEKGNFSHKLLHYKPDSGDELYRRSLYTFIRRTSPHPAMIAFDAPNRDVCVVKRERTNTPLQALVLLNDPQFVEAARVMGQRLEQEGGESTEEKITTGFRLATSRKPSKSEVTSLMQLYEEAKANFETDMAAADSLLSIGEYPLKIEDNRAETAAWTVVSQTLLNHDEVYTKR